MDAQGSVRARPRLFRPKSGEVLGVKGESFTLLAAGAADVPHLPFTSGRHRDELMATSPSQRHGDTEGGQDPASMQEAGWRGKALPVGSAGRVCGSQAPAAPGKCSGARRPAECMCRLWRHAGRVSPGWLLLHCPRPNCLIMFSSVTEPHNSTWQALGARVNGGSRLRMWRKPLCTPVPSTPWLTSYWAHNTVISPSQDPALPITPCEFLST